MKMQLDLPFTEDFKAAYLGINKEPRRVVSLIYKNGNRTSMSYARYLMCCKLKRFLGSDEHVDHIDNDKLNDVIDNLQILTLLENNRKSNKGRLFISYICPGCHRQFDRPKNKSHLSSKGMYTSCSRNCSRKVQTWAYNNGGKETLKLIGAWQILSVFRKKITG